LDQSHSIHTEEQIDAFCSSIINEPIPLHKTQWELHFVENYSSTESAIIWKSHHVLGDGVSGQFCFLALSDEYDKNGLPPIRKVHWYEKILMKVLAVLYFPLVIYKMATIKENRNPINNKAPLSGAKNCHCGQDFKLDDLKEASKKRGAKLNDYIMGLFGTALKEYCEGKGCQTEEVVATVPVNLRYEHPQTVDMVECCNKFSVLFFKLPLFKSIEKSLESTRKLMEAQKKSFEYYASYIFAHFSLFLLPH